MFVVIERRWTLGRDGSCRVPVSARNGSDGWIGQQPYPNRIVAAIDMDVPSVDLIG
jgi:hypothetical protein